MGVGEKSFSSTLLGSVTEPSELNWQKIRERKHKFYF